MNSIDDLRSVLTTQATNADGLDPITRTRQLSERVRRVRRRRTVAVSIAAATVVVAGSVAVLPGLLSDDADDSLLAARTVLGDVAPETVTALGLTYAFEESRASADTTSVTVTPERIDDEAPLLSWTTSDPDAQITVTGRKDGEDDSLLWTSARSEFSDHVVLEAWEGGPVTVTSSEPGLGVASYTFDADVPVPGVTAHGVTFRSPVAGRSLLPGRSAALESGAGAVTLADGPLADVSGEVTIATFCSGLNDTRATERDDEFGVEVLLNGESVAWSGGCSDEPAPGRAWGGITISPADADKDGDLEVRLTQGIENPRAYEGSIEDVVLGVAVYEPYQFVTVGEVLSDETLEWGGHLWRVDQTVRREGPGRTSTTLDSADPHLLRAVAAGDITDRSEPFWGPRGHIRLTVDGEQVDAASLSQQPDGVATAAMLLPSGTERISLDVDAPNVEESAVLIYTRVD